MNETLESVLHEVEGLPEEQQERIVRVIKEEVSKAKREVAAAAPGRWARLAERLSRESPFEGRSGEVLRQVREFREGFMMLESERRD